MAGAIRDCLADSPKPVIGFVSPHAPEVARALTRHGVPAFAAAEGCAAALRGMSEAGARDGGEADEGGLPPGTVEGLPRGSLDEHEAKRLFARFGIPCVRESVVDGPAQAERAARELGGRVVLKMLSAAITHKSDVGGVAVDLAPEAGARLASMARE